MKTEIVTGRYGIGPIPSRQLSRRMALLRRAESFLSEQIASPSL